MKNKLTNTKLIRIVDAVHEAWIGMGIRHCDHCKCYSQMIREIKRKTRRGYMIVEICPHCNSTVYVTINGYVFLKTPIAPYTNIQNVRINGTVRLGKNWFKISANLNI